MDKMTFKSASEFKITFGKYAGQTLDKIAESDEGLLYLDWIMSWKIDGIKEPACREAIDVYMSHPTIKNEVGRLVAE